MHVHTCHSPGSLANYVSFFFCCFTLLTPAYVNPPSQPGLCAHLSAPHLGKLLYFIYFAFAHYVVPLGPVLYCHGEQI
jgi:hypothetical protein